MRALHQHVCAISYPYLNTLHHHHPPHTHTPHSHPTPPSPHSHPTPLSPPSHQDYSYEDLCYGRRRWDNSHVLRKHLSFLVPAFDPRPGKSFIPALQDFNVPPPGSEQPEKHTISSSSQPALKLSLKVCGGRGCGVCCHAYCE